MAVKAIPDGYHSVTVYLICRNAAKAIDFYKAAFGATEVMRLATPDGMIGHAEVKIGDSFVMLADEWPGMSTSPESLKGTTVGLCVYLPNVDAAFEKAVAAGATVERPVQDQFYGDRSGTVIDPFGHKWTLATHINDIPPEDMQKHFEDFMKKQSGG